MQPYTVYVIRLLIPTLPLLSVNCSFCPCPHHELFGEKSLSPAYTEERVFTEIIYNTSTDNTNLFLVHYH